MHSATTWTVRLHMCREPERCYCISRSLLSACVTSSPSWCNAIGLTATFNFYESHQSTPFHLPPPSTCPAESLEDKKMATDLTAKRQLLPDADRLLKTQYGCGPVQFAGTSDALYERHLLFDIGQ